MVFISPFAFFLSPEALMPIPILQDTERDALTEVCSVGMRHAATALSQLMGKGVTIKVPRLLTLESSGLSELLDAQKVIGLHLQILGSVRGSILILLEEKNARSMLELLLGRYETAQPTLSEMEVSTLKEVGNILASACLNALGNTLKMTLLPSVPSLVTGEAREVLGRIQDPPASEEILMIDTMFSISDTLCGGSIFLMPAASSLCTILTALGAR
jgi:chemotaxis protein CheC